MKVTIPKGNYGLIEFYDTVAREMGYTNISNLEYDCTKINVAENIQDGFYSYYTENAKETNPNANMTDVRTSITMILAINGPKVDESLKANEVEIFDGFICQKVNKKWK